MPQRLAWLDSAEAVKLIPSSKRRRRLRRPLLALQRLGQASDPHDGDASAWGVMATTAEVELASEGLLAWCASYPWAMEVRAELNRAGLLSTSAASNIAHALRGRVYPTWHVVTIKREDGTTFEAQRPAKRRCSRCGHVTPVGYLMGSGICRDCGTESVEELAESFGVADYLEKKSA